VLNDIGRACEAEHSSDDGLTILDQSLEVSRWLGEKVLLSNGFQRLHVYHESRMKIVMNQAGRWLGLDDDLRSQLSHASDQLSELRRDCFRLLHSRAQVLPHDGVHAGIATRIQLRAVVMASEILIKVRQLLDHALTRFLRDYVYRQRNWRLLQAHFPMCLSEQDLRSHFKSMFEAAAAASEHEARSDVVDLATQYPAAWAGLCQAQAFHQGPRRQRKFVAAATSGSE